MKIVKLNESNNPIKYYISIGRNPGTILLNAVLFRTKEGKQLVCRSVDTITNLLKIIDITNGLVDGESLTGIEPYQASELRFAADFNSLEEAKQFILCWAKIQRFYFDIHFNFANNTEEADKVIYENYTIVGIDQNTNEIVSNYIITRDDLYDGPLKRSAGFVKKSREITEALDTPKWGIGYQNPAFDGRYVSSVFFTTDAGDKTELKNLDDFKQLENKLKSTDLVQFGKSLTELDNTESPYLSECMWFDTLDDAKYAMRVWADLWRYWARQHPRYSKSNHDDMIKAILLSVFVLCEVNPNPEQVLQTYTLSKYDLINPAECARSKSFIKKGSREMTEEINKNIYYVLCADQNKVGAWSVVDGLILRAPKPNQDPNAIKQLVTTKCTTYNEFMQLERAVDNGIITPINTISIDYSNELVRKGQDLTTALMFDNIEFAIDIFRAVAKAYLTIYSFSKDVKQNLLDGFFIGEWDDNLKMGVNTYKLTEADINGGPRTFARSTGFVKKGSSRESN